MLIPEQESPPPEPTPSPPPTPEPVRRPAVSERPTYDAQGDTTMSGTTHNPSVPSPSPLPTPSQPSYTQQYPTARPSPSPAPLIHQSSYGSHTSNHALPQSTPMYQPQANYNQYTTASTPAPQHTNHANYQYQTNHAVSRPAVPATASYGATGNAYNPPRAVEVYTLPEAANNQIPADIRAQFHRDDQGRVIFFTAPPLGTTADESNELTHSLRYLADKARRREGSDKRRKEKAEEQASIEAGQQKRTKQSHSLDKDSILEQNLGALRMWSDQIERGTDSIYQKMYGEEWANIRESGMYRLKYTGDKLTSLQTDLELQQRSITL